MGCISGCTIPRCALGIGGQFCRHWSEGVGFARDTFGILPTEQMYGLTFVHFMDDLCAHIMRKISLSLLATWFMPLIFKRLFG